MKIAEKQLTLYAITDRRWLQQGQTLASQVEQAVLGGATVIQLREKHATHKEFLEIAVAVKEITDRYNVPLIINDDVDIALAVDAAGVHVGQEDLEAGAVREKLGEGKIIGVSARTVEQALAAQQAGADYLGVGAVFQTGSKADAKSVSMESLRAICDTVQIPVVAIGGIDAENMPQLQGSGIAGVAVISAIFAQPDVRDAAEQLLHTWQKMQNQKNNL